MPRRSTTRITRTLLNQLTPRPGGTCYYVWDADLVGFGVAVSNITGQQTYVVQYRSTRRTIERANLISVDEARGRAMQVLAMLRQGKDPKADKKAAEAEGRRRAEEEKQEQQRGMTMQEVLDHLLKHRTSLAAETVRTYKTLAANYLGDWLDRPLIALTKPDTRELHHRVAEDVRRRNRDRRTNGLAAANMTLRLVKRLWNYAEREELIPDLPKNPVRDLGWFKEKPKPAHITDDLLSSFYKAVMDSPNVTFRDMVLMGLFSGMRMGELSHLKWSAYDRKLGVLRQLESAELNKSKRDWELPLTDVVLEILERRWAHRESEVYIFPVQQFRHRHDGPVPSGKPMSLLRSIAKDGTIPYFNPHALRHTYATAAENAGLDDKMVKRLLNHSLGQDVTARYTHASRDNVRAAAQTVADYLKRRIGLPVAEPNGLRLIA